MTFAALRSLAFRRRSLAWLLALLAWLPFAQWAAATHPLVHLGTVAGDAGERAAHLPGSCEICVVAAAIGGAAPPAAVPLAILPRLPDAQASAPAATWRPAAFAAGYRSRAPPSLPA